MGKRRRARDDDETPAVETVEELGALETACTVLDNEVDRLMRILGASQELRKLTDQVRQIVATAGPLVARREALEAEIAKLEARQAELAATVEATYETVRTQQAELSTLNEQVAAAQRAREEALAKLR